MAKKDKGLNLKQEEPLVKDALPEFWMLFKSTDIGSYFVKKSNQPLCNLFRKIRSARSDCQLFLQEEIDILHSSQSDYVRLS